MPRFRHIVQSAGNAYSRLRSKSLIPAYGVSGSQSSHFYFLIWEENTGFHSFIYVHWR